MGVPADELAQRLTETEFREHMADLAKEPDESTKLDLIIGILHSILEANVSLAASWQKGYRPPDLADNIPKWGRKRKRKAMAPQSVLDVIRSFKKRPDTL